MPKVHNTRGQRAAKLLQRLETGPAFDDGSRYGRGPFTEEEAQHQYRLWAQSWVLEELRDLVPELRQASR